MGSSILCPVYVSWAAISFFSCWFFADFEDFCAVLLVYKVSGSRFPFWRFPWVFLSLNFLYNLKFWLQNIPIDRRKLITFASFLSALFLIWDFSSVISPVVYNRRSFCHRSCLALITTKQSSPWTFRFGEWSCTCLTFKIYDCSYQSYWSIPCFF